MAFSAAVGIQYSCKLSYSRQGGAQKMLPTSWCALTLSPPLSGHISAPFIVSATVASPGTESDCQCYLKLYILGAENVLLSLNCKDIILSDQSTEERRGEGVPLL